MIVRLTDSGSHHGRRIILRVNEVLLEGAVFGGLILCAAAAVVHDIGEWTGFW